MKRENSQLVPLLAEFSTPRVGCDELPGEYDGELDVWVVPTDNGVTPIIEASKGLAELVSKTCVERERDDPDYPAVLQTITKTNAEIESDDDLLGEWHS